MRITTDEAALFFSTFYNRKEFSPINISPSEIVNYHLIRLMTLRFAPCI